MESVARSAVQYDFGMSPEEVGRRVARMGMVGVKWAYNEANEKFHSPYVYVGAKVYLGFAMLIPELWGTIPRVGAYVGYQEALPPGVQFPKWK